MAQEGKSVIWLSHATRIVRCSPEVVRPASLREWQQVANSDLTEQPKSAGGASSFLDLSHPSSHSVPVPSHVDIPVPSIPTPTAIPTVNIPDEANQPEQELTPQVSVRSASSMPPALAPSVELAPGLGAPVGSTAQGSAAVPVADLSPPEIDAQHVPLPTDDNVEQELEDAHFVDDVLLASHDLGVCDQMDQPIYEFMTLSSGPDACAPPLAEDGLPYVEQPLEPSECQAYCLEIPIKARDVRRWQRETVPEQLASLASAGKRARCEVHLKNLNAQDQAL